MYVSEKWGATQPRRDPQVNQVYPSHVIAFPEETVKRARFEIPVLKWENEASLTDHGGGGGRCVTTKVE
jgi:hypothetical protein